MHLGLTKRGEYGVRIAIYLATQPDDERLTAQALARDCAIPAGNVPTIVNLLSRAGILDSTPGRHGGCRLARPAGAISVLEVVECLEGDFDTARCLLDSRRCGDKQPECPLHASWKAGRDAAVSSLAGTSLEAAARRQRELARPAAARRRKAGEAGGRSA